MIEVRRTGDEGPVDQEELALETMRKRPSDGRFPGSRRPGKQNSALWLQIELGGQRVVLQRQRDVRLEALNHVVEALQVA